MATILNIETSTKNCSVSISKNGNIIALKELNDGNYSHGEKLHLFIKQIIIEASISYNDLNAIAVSKGPGSYTGLRIGVSAAKGFCFALDIPLISINTLKSLAKSTKIKHGCIIPMLDARRMEVYSAIFDLNNNQIRETKAEIIDKNSFSKQLKKGKVTFIGDATKKSEQIIKHKNAFFLHNILPSSKDMASLSFKKFNTNKTENTAYFEPFYLKDFIVTPQKNKKNRS